MGGEELSKFDLSETHRNEANNLITEVLRETSYDIDSLTRFLEENVPKLLSDQQLAYTTVIDQVTHKRGRLYFLDAPGGTGKSFVTNLVLAKSGRTAYAAFKLLFRLTSNDEPVCNISKSSSLAQVLKKCTLIIWDEATICHRKSVEAVNRMLQDLHNSNCLMRGVTVVLSGIPIMLLRNLSQLKLRNGTKLVVKKLMRNVLQTTIISGCGKGEDVFIPRLPLIPSNIPFEFK
uniref:ATP-dependent DNA helicase n=1 Tax=Octopus bimaculoides TaxID=37653 RepID=A0A0L8IFD7_OCTBM